MTKRNVLLVALDPVPEDEVRRAIAERTSGEEAQVHVVAPTAHAGKFEWLTGADDDARAEAAELADRTAHAVDAEVETEVEREVGEHDPVLAAEDALALFPADEILVAGTPDEKTVAGLRGLGLPISRVGGGIDSSGTDAIGADAYAKDVAEGYAQETPFVVVGTVAAFIFAVVAVVSLISFLIFWLV